MTYDHLNRVLAEYHTLIGHTSIYFEVFIMIKESISYEQTTTPTQQTGAERPRLAHFRLPNRAKENIANFYNVLRKYHHTYPQ